MSYILQVNDNLRNQAAMVMSRHHPKFLSRLANQLNFFLHCVIIFLLRKNRKLVR